MLFLACPRVHLSHVITYCTVCPTVHSLGVLMYNLQSLLSIMSTYILIGKKSELTPLLMSIYEVGIGMIWHSHCC